jgi:glycine dehydrogenase subunit 1
MRYLPNSDSDRAAMLQAMGKSRVEELFEQIPREMRFEGRLNLPGPLAEPQILDYFRSAARQSSNDHVSFFGRGRLSALDPRGG